jgi:hypothetical protein
MEHINSEKRKLRKKKYGKLKILIIRKIDNKKFKIMK